MRKIILTSLFCLVSLCIGQLAYGQGFAEHIGITARGGTLGPGVELTTSLTSKLNLRLGANYFSHSRSDVVSDLEVEVRADSDVKLNSFAALVDFMVVGRWLRLTGGVVLNQHKVTALLTPTGNYTLNDKEFAPEKIGTLTATLGHQLKVNPYLGLGLGYALPSRNKVGLFLDLGMLYTGSPRFEMSGTGMIAPTAGEAPEIEQRFESFKFYPVLALGLTYKI